KNVEIPTRGGSHVSANVFRPDSAEPVPALLCYSIYSKDLHTQDAYPSGWAHMRRRIPGIGERSTLGLHTFEANDPEVWVPWGYACVRVDVPGSGKSPGRMDPLSPAEARAGYDAVEWIAAQPWCNGKVGMTGISYLAMTQWVVASEQPPHLAAIVPWEGVSDFYRDWARHGGMLSTFATGWNAGTRSRQHGRAPSGPGDFDDPSMPIGGRDVRSDDELRADRFDALAELRAHPLDDPVWRDRSPALERITVPLLSAGNWGGIGLHLRGNVEGF